MQTSNLFEFLHDAFSAHSDFAVKRFTVRGNERFLVGLHDHRVTFLRIEQGEPLLLFFWALRDLHKLRALPGLGRTPYGRMFEIPGHAYNWNFERAVGIEAGLIKPEDLFEALVQIAAQTSMRKLLPRDDDAHMVTRLREYYFAEGEWETQHALEKLVEHVDETNLDFAMDCIREIDPWMEEDPDHALGTMLIVLDELVQDHQRCIPQARPHLIYLREAYQSLGPKAKHDLSEVEYLIDLVARQMN
jgi:hypothetical protein